MTLTSSERKLRASVAAHAMHAKHDPMETTRAARAAFVAKFLDEVDPDGSLRRDQPEEALRRAESKRRQYFAQLSYAALKARKKKRTASTSVRFVEDGRDASSQLQT